MSRTRIPTPVLVVTAVVSVAVFVLLPRPVGALLAGGGHGDGRRLASAVTSAFVGYWDAGDGTPTPELAALVGYWRAYHAVKALAALVLLVVAVVLAVRLWSAYAGGGGRRAATGAVIATSSSLVAFALLLANVQGVVAPFSSLMSMLPVMSARGDLAVMVVEVEQQAARHPDGGSAPLRVMVDDLARYHLVVAATSAATAAVLVVALVVLVRRWRRAGRARPRLVAGGVAATLVVASLLAVLGIANTTTALDSARAAREFYRGGY